MTTRSSVIGVLIAFLSLPAFAIGQTLEYRGEPGETHRYVRTQVDHITQTVNGAEQVLDINSLWRFSTTVREAGPDGLVVEVVHDSLSLSGLPQTAAFDPSPIYGKPLVVTMGTRGEIRDVAIPESLPAELGRLNLETTYRTFFPTLPGGDVRSGQSWSDSVNVSTNQNGIDIDVGRVTQYTAAGMATHAGHEALQIEFTSAIELDGSGAQGGNEISITGAGTSSGSYYFDRDEGLFLGGDETSEIKMDAFVVAGDQNLLIPVVQQRTETIELAE